MTFEELLEAMQKIPCEEKRERNTHYCEVVVDDRSLGPVNHLLEECFGPPLKPAGKSPSSEASACSEPYGGIHGNQVLYHRLTSQGSEIAMLWPWQNGKSITVKVIRR